MGGFYISFYFLLFKGVFTLDGSFFEIWNFLIFSDLRIAFQAVFFFWGLREVFLGFYGGFRDFWRFYGGF